MKGEKDHHNDVGDTACAHITRWNMYTSVLLIIQRIISIRDKVCMDALVTSLQGCIDNRLLLMIKKRGGLLSSQNALLYSCRCHPLNLQYRRAHKDAYHISLFCIMAMVRNIPIVEYVMVGIIVYIKRSGSIVEQ